MEELVNFIGRVPASEKSAFWKEEHLQKWVYMSCCLVACALLLTVWCLPTSALSLAMPQWVLANVLSAAGEEMASSV